MISSMVNVNGMFFKVSMPDTIFDEERAKDFETVKRALNALNDDKSLDDR